MRIIRSSRSRRSEKTITAERRRARSARNSTADSTRVSPPGVSASSVSRMAFTCEGSARGVSAFVTLPAKTARPAASCWRTSRWASVPASVQA